MWFLFSLFAALTAALMTIIGKLGLKGIDPTFATGVRSLVMFIFMAAVVILSGKLKGLSSLDTKALWIIVLSAVCGALSWLFYFLALKTAPASKVAAIDRSSLIFVVLFSVFFLAEKLNLKLAVGSIFATLGIILITLA